MNYAKKEKPNFFYGYIVVVAMFFIQILSFGLYNTRGIFFVQLSTEFGWTRAVTSGPFSLAAFMFGLVSIIAGRLNDKFSPRLVMTIFFLVLGSGYVLMSQVNAVWHFYLFYGVIIGVGMSGSDVPVLSTLARWFVKKRGLMTGITKVGAGLGMLSMPLVTNWLISNYEWRIAYLIIGLVLLVVLVSAAQFIRRDPSQIGQLPDGEKVTEVSPASEDREISLRQAMHTRQFWLLTAVYFLFNFCVFTVMTHIYPHAVDLGISETVAANFLATVGGASIIGRLAMGSASDRIGNKLAMIIGLIILAVALLWLQLANETWELYLFVALYGFAHGGLFTLISPMTAELFGLGSLGTILGVLTFLGTVGGTIAPVAVGYIFDATGSYQLGFIITAAASIIAVLLMININVRRYR